jgi:hypothetical protein
VRSKRSSNEAWAVKVHQAAQLQCPLNTADNTPIYLTKHPLLSKTRIQKLLLKNKPDEMRQLLIKPRAPVYLYCRLSLYTSITHSINACNHCMNPASAQTTHSIALLLQKAPAKHCINRMNYNCICYDALLAEILNELCNKK